MVIALSQNRENKSRKIAQEGGNILKTDFLISNISTGKLNAMVKNVMAQIGVTDPEEAIRMVNAGEVQISIIKPEWTEKDGVIHFSVISDRTTGEEWIARLESKGFRIGDDVKSVLRSKSFKPTNGVYEIAILKGELFYDNERFTENIRKNAKSRKLATPNVEIACLIREKFSDKELKAMGLYWIVIMHKPIKDFDGDPRLLSANCRDDGSWLAAYYGDPGGRWSRTGGFAFVVR